MSAAKRSPAGIQRERRRARSTPTLIGSNPGDECDTGHPAMFAMSPAFHLGRIPEGGGYPLGFVELCARLMAIPAGELGDVLHVCSGSLQAARTIDIRAGLGATIRADVRWLPIRPGSIRWIMADPPYGRDYAAELWNLGLVYPTPTVLIRECAQVLAPGGRVAFLHHVVPRLPDELERVGTFGVTTGPGYRIRALTIARRRDTHHELEL